MHSVNIHDIIEITKKAGDVAMSFYEKEYDINEKENKTPVTEADLAINNFLTEELSKYGYPILSEESEDDFEKRKNAEFVWIVDPLDGTADFIQKNGEFSIMIGLANKKGEAILGVVYAPALDELYFAEKGRGASIISNGKELKIKTSKKGLKYGTILVSRNHGGELEQKIAEKHNMRQIPMGSAGLKICRIARGDAELYINSSDKSGIWDTCAGDIILTEAGGKMANLKGSELVYNKKELIHLKGTIAGN